MARWKTRPPGTQDAFLSVVPGRREVCATMFYTHLPTSVDKVSSAPQMVRRGGISRENCTGIARLFSIVPRDGWNRRD